MTVFVLALLFITAVELISGKPLSAIFGGADTGTTLKNLVNPSPAPATTPTSTTSTTTTPSSTTTHESTHDDHERWNGDQYHRAGRRRDHDHGARRLDDHDDSGSRDGRDDDDDFGAVVPVAARATSP